MSSKYDSLCGRFSHSSSLKRIILSLACRALSSSSSLMWASRVFCKVSMLAWVFLRLFIIVGIIPTSATMMGTQASASPNQIAVFSTALTPLSRALSKSGHRRCHPRSARFLAGIESMLCMSYHHILRQHPSIRKDSPSRRGRSA